MSDWAASDWKPIFRCMSAPPCATLSVWKNSGDWIESPDYANRERLAQDCLVALAASKLIASAVSFCYTRKTCRDEQEDKSTRMGPRFGWRPFNDAFAASSPLPRSAWSGHPGDRHPF